MHALNIIRTEVRAIDDPTGINPMHGGTSGGGKLSYFLLQLRVFSMSENETARRVAGSVFVGKRTITAFYRIPLTQCSGKKAPGVHVAPRHNISNLSLLMRNTAGLNI